MRWRRAGGEVGRKKLGSMGNEYAVGKGKARAAVTVVWGTTVRMGRAVWLLVQQAVSDMLQLGADWADTSHAGW